MVGIYKITSPSGKVYIGQSWNIRSRKALYKGLYCTKQPRLYNSLKLYGWDSHTFTILHELPADITQDTLNTYETFYVNQFKETGHEMLNTKEPGSNGKHSEESRKKMIESRRYHGITGRTLPSEVIERRQKTRLANGGYNFSEEWKEKQRKAKRGIPKTREHIEKVKQVRKEKKVGYKRVKDIETLTIFDSIKQAAEYFKCSREIIYGKIRKGKIVYVDQITPIK